MITSFTPALAELRDKVSRLASQVSIEARTELYAQQVPGRYQFLTMGIYKELKTMISTLDLLASKESRYLPPEVDCSIPEVKGEAKLLVH